MNRIPSTAAGLRAAAGAFVACLIFCGAAASAPLRFAATEMPRPDPCMPFITETSAWLQKHWPDGVTFRYYTVSDMEKAVQNREASGERAGVPAFDRASVEEHVAVLGGEKACGDAEHGGLARAVGADERRDLSLRDLERDVVDHGNAVVELGERLDGEHGHGGSESFAAKDEIEEVDAAHDRDEDAHGDAEGCEVLDGELSAREHDDADEDAACDERAVAVGHEEAARRPRRDARSHGTLLRRSLCTLDDGFTPRAL